MSLIKLNKQIPSMSDSKLYFQSKSYFQPDEIKIDTLSINVNVLKNQIQDLNDRVDKIEQINKDLIIQNTTLQNKLNLIGSTLNSSFSSS